MKLGFVSAILPESSLEEVLKFAGEQNFDCVEFMCWPTGKAERRYAGVTHIDVTEFTATDANKVRELTRKYNVNISALGYYPNPLSSDPEESTRVTAHLKKVIQAAALLDVNHVNSFIGRDPKKSIDENWPRFLEVWKPLIKFAEEQGVRVGIENCPMYFSADEWPSGKNLAISPAVWRRMFKDIPSANFGLNFDPSHLVWQHMDYLKPLNEFASRIFHVHAKDVRVDREKLNDVGILGTPLQYHCPKLPGLGEIEWGRFFSVLGDAGYTGPVCIEVEDRAYEANQERRKDALRQSGSYLRNFIR